MPLVDPQLVRQAFEQNQQVRGYYSVADVLDVDHYDERRAVDRALVLGVRELDQSALNSDVQNWLNLHTVYTHGNDIIAAFANQRDARTSRWHRQGTSDKTPWAEGNQSGQRRALGRRPAATRRASTSARTAPTTPSSARPLRTRPDVELDLQTSPGEAEADEQRPTTTYDGEGGVPVGSTFRKLLYAHQVRRARTSCSRGGSTRTARCSTSATRVSGCRRSRRG